MGLMNFFKKDEENNNVTSTSTFKLEKIKSINTTSNKINEIINNYTVDLNESITPINLLEFNKILFENIETDFKNNKLTTNLNNFIKISKLTFENNKYLFILVDENNKEYNCEFSKINNKLTITLDDYKIISTINKERALIFIDKKEKFSIHSKVLFKESEDTMNCVFASYNEHEKVNVLDVKIGKNGKINEINEGLFIENNHPSKIDFEWKKKREAEYLVNLVPKTFPTLSPMKILSQREMMKNIMDGTDLIEELNEKLTNEKKTSQGCKSKF